jgi:methyltransferase
MTTFVAFVFFLLAQRAFELSYSRRNELILRRYGALEFDPTGYRLIVALHTLFFASLIAEKLLLQRQPNPFWLPLLGLFIAAQFLRYWSIRSLGVMWTTKILVVPGAKLVTTGPYRYIRHPNYLAVVIEFITIPLIFSCYYTAVVFNVLNLLVLKRRIAREEAALCAYASKP